LHSEGIDKVFVNGDIVWENNISTNLRPGMFLSGKCYNK